MKLVRNKFVCIFALFIVMFFLLLSCEQVTNITSPNGDETNNDIDQNATCTLTLDSVWSNFGNCEYPKFNVGFYIYGLDELDFSYQYVYIDVCFLKGDAYYTGRLTANKNVNQGTWRSDSSSIKILDSSPLIDGFPSYVQIELQQRNCDKGDIRQDDEYIRFVFYPEDKQAKTLELFAF